MRVQSLSREDPLEKEITIHSSTLAWKTPWMEEPDRLQSMGSQRLGHIFTFTTEAEDIKKRWQEYIEELYKKDLHDQDNQDGVITHLEPDILECEVKWALESITMNKASGGDGVPAEVFQVLTMMLLKCCTQYASKLG